MSIRQIRTEELALTPSLCEQFSTMPKLLGERDLRDSHVDFLRRILEDGRFISPLWSVVAVKDTSQELRCDGQHSSTMLTKISKTQPERFPEGLMVVIRHYEIDSIDGDAADLFNSFDNPKSARTNGDAMSIYRAHFPVLKDIENPYLVNVAKGIDFYLAEKTREIQKDNEKAATKAAKKRQVIELTELPVRFSAREYGNYWRNPQYLDFALWLTQWKGTRCAWIIKKHGVVAQILASWLTVPQQALRYWGFVFREDHADPEHSSRKLVLKLRALGAKPHPKADDYRNLAEELWATYLLKEPNPPEEELEAESPAGLPLFATPEPSISQLSA